MRVRRKRSALMACLEYLVTAFAYEFLLLVCLAPVIVPLSLLPESLIKGPIIQAAIGIFLLVWFGVGSWIAHNAALRFAFQREGFVQAIGSAFAEVRLMIAFLPVVGTLFPVRSRKISPFDRPDDPRPL